MKRLVVAVALSIVFGSTLAGCTAGVQPEAGQPDAATPLATASPTPADARGLAITDCDDLVSADAQKKYTAQGWVLSAGFVQRMADQRSHLTTFVDYGGALCQWGMPNTDASDVFAGSAIDDVQEAAQRGFLEGEGYTLDQHNGADRYTRVTNDSYFEIYLFTGDHWFFGSDESAADRARQSADVG